MIGSGQNGELTAIDILSILSFLIGIKNLDLNIDQNDMDAQKRDSNERASKLVNSAISEIHEHLEKQDRKIDVILQKLGETDEKNQKTGGQN